MKRIELLLGASGLALLAFVAARVGWADLIHQLEAVRAGLLILITLSFARLALQTISWSVALRAQGVPASIFELAGIRLASQAIGYLSVFGPAISEPMKLRLLRKHQDAGIVATLADTGTYGFAACLFGIIGCICSGLVIVNPEHLIPLYVLGAILVAGFALLLRSNPVIAPLIRILGARCPRWLKDGERIEVGVRRFWRQYPSKTHLMFWLDLGCQVLFAGDIVAIFWCLGIPFHALTILALETASRAGRMIAGCMPARLGVDEAGAAAAFAALGLPTASGIILALSRRLRDLLGCVLGMVWLVFMTKSSRGSDPEKVGLLSPLPPMQGPGYSADRHCAG